MRIHESAEKFFGIPASELIKIKEHGYTKEDLLALDHSEEDNVFCKNLDDAMGKASDLKLAGYRTIDIVKTANDNDWYHYYVLCSSYKR